MTLVSTAFMPLSNVPADALIQLFERMRLRRVIPEHRLMEISGSVTADPPHRDAIPIPLPFENRAGPYAEAAPNIGRDGNLPL